MARRGPERTFGGRLRATSSYHSSVSEKHGSTPATTPRYPKRLWATIWPTKKCASKAVSLRMEASVPQALLAGVPLTNGFDTDVRPQLQPDPVGSVGRVSPVDGERQAGAIRQG